MLLPTQYCTLCIVDLWPLHDHYSGGLEFYSIPKFETLLVDQAKYTSLVIDFTLLDQNV